MFIIYKGDDSDFAGLNSFVINIKTDFSLANFTGKFSFQGIDKSFTKEEIGVKSVSFTYSSAETSKFAPGLAYGRFYLFDQDNKVCHIQKVWCDVKIHRESAGGPTTQTIEIECETVCDYTKMRNRPKINGVEVVGVRDGKEYHLNEIRPYSEEKTYRVENQVVFADTIYQCISEITAPEPFTASHWKQIGGKGGGGGTTDYNALTNKPQINGKTLQGNVSLATIGAVARADFSSIDPETVTIQQLAAILKGI